jgi:hypothetical protein
MRCLAVFCLVYGITLPAWAEGVPAPTPPNESEIVKCAACVPCPTCPTCPPATAPGEKKVNPHPFYVTDWQRLAELTKDDNRVFPLADAYAKKLDNAYIVGGIGITLGAGVAFLSTLSRLTNDHWTTPTQWGLAGGLSAAVLATLMGWTMAPSRDDLYTVINTWNLRNPAHLLAP